MRIAAVLLMLIAGLGAGSLLDVEHDAFWQRFTLVSVFAVLSMLAFYGHAKTYRGGAATIIGAVLLGVAVFATASAIEDGGLSGSAKQTTAALTVIALLCTGGIALLSQGHKHHMLLLEKERASRRQ